MATRNPVTSQVTDGSEEAEMLLQVPSADVDEIRQPPNCPPSVGQRQNVVKGVELLVMAVSLSADQLEEARQQLGAAPGTLTVTPGEPVVVLLCGEYKIPLLPNVPARRSSPFNYVFYIPNLPLGINLAPSTPPEILEAFEFIVKSYGTLQTGAIPPLTPSHYAPPGPLPMVSPAAEAAGGAPGNADFAGRAPPPAQTSDRGLYMQVNQANRAPPPPHYGGATLEEQQQVALAAARNCTEYVMPRTHPGSQTMIIQTHPDLPQVRAATRVSHGITELTRRAAEIITGGADLGARGIAGGATYVVDNTERTQDPVHVPETVRNKLRTGRNVSRGAVAVSTGFAASVVGVSSVVSTVASGALRAGLSAQPAPGHEPTAFDDAKDIGLATVGGVLTVADAATEAARSLLTAGIGGVTRIVSHKLGDEAGQVAEDGLGMVSDAAQASSNVKRGGIKAVVKNTVKDTAKKTFT